MKQPLQLVMSSALMVACSSPATTNPAGSGGQGIAGATALPAGQAGAGAAGTAAAGSSGASTAQAGTSGAGTGGQAIGGMAGSTAAAGASGSAGSDVGGDGGEGAGGQGNDEPTDMMPWFTFFTTSQTGLVSFADDPEEGLGGDLGGLEGADDICAQLAQRSNPGDTKTWRAFLSATEGPDGNPVNAIDRVGPGPWHDFNNRLLAETIEQLLPGADERPAGADPQLAEMFTDENGEPVSPDTSEVDNHDMLTGSNEDGELDGGLRDTCQDWTSADADMNDRPMIGHAWPRSQNSGRHWIAEHRAGGCAPGIDTRVQGSNGTNTVGAGGGYGGFYCFAVAE